MYYGLSSCSFTRVCFESGIDAEQRADRKQACNVYPETAASELMMSFWKLATLLEGFDALLHL